MNKTGGFVFEKLTPISDSDLGIYEDALDFVFKNNDIRNVAISGAYGAGKSSVLESYKRKHSEQKYVHISLAHFSETSESDCNESVKESVLEGKILNQLIHQIPPDRIPQTNFKVKKTSKKGKWLLSTLLLLSLFVSILAFKYSIDWKAIVESIQSEWMKKMLLYTTTSGARIVFGIIAFSIIGFFLYKIIQIQINNHFFQRINIKGNEIEIFEKTEESYFDKYLNEVLYLFENVDADIIAFEDMDRFDANRIFERLREVNTLANLQRTKERKDVLRFFYLLRDDIFVSKDRTKFFDYIIPIIPVVDSSNSYDQFILHLKKNDIFEQFDESFLQGLSLYVDDMRLLKNICNEFLVFCSRLNTTELDYNKMLALIVYKNLFPRDYSDLQLNKGFVFTIFQNKETFATKEKEEILLRIKNIEERVNRAYKEFLQSKEELNYVLSAKEAEANRVYSSQIRQQFQEWKRNEFPKREQAIEDNKTNKINELENEREVLRNQLLLVDSKPLKQIITRDNINEIFSIKTTNEIGQENDYKDIRSNDYFSLLKYLIRNGYIDETYADYMTYFYESSIARIDKVFLRSVTDKKAKDYTYQLQNPKTVFDRLKPIDFDQEETLNFTLTDYVFQNESDSEKANHFIQQLKSSKNYSFVEQYFSYTSSVGVFVRPLCDIWPEMFYEVLSNNKMSANHIKTFSLDILYYLEDSSVQSVNVDNVLTNYISSVKDYLAIEKPKINLLIRRFGLLNVFFQEIDYNTSNQGMLIAVYENGNYAINYQNIMLFLSVVFKESNEKDIRHKMSTLVFKKMDSPLAQKMSKNMDSFLSVVIDECENEICDDPEIVLYILNNDSLSAEYKNTYIQRLKTLISDLSLVQDKSLWKPIVSNRAVALSEKNVFEYFIENNLDNIIIDFINDSSLMLDFSNVNEHYISQKKKLFHAFVNSPRLSDNAFRRVVPSFMERFDDFSYSGITTPKMRVLISEKIIQMNENSLEFMREKYPDLLDIYIEQNIDEYVELIDASLFSQEELLSVLSMNVSDDQKLILLKMSNTPISVQGKTYSDQIKEHIFLNNLFLGDIPFLYSSYSEHNERIQDLIFGYACNKTETIKTTIENIDKRLMDRLLRATEIDQDLRTELLIAYFDHLNSKEISSYLALLGKAEFTKIFDLSSRPRFENTALNEKLLCRFKERKWISGFTQNNSYISIQRRHPKRTKE